MVKRYTFNERLYVSLNDYAKAVKNAASLACELHRARTLATYQARSIRKECEEKVLNLVKLLEEAKAITSCGNRLALLAQHRLKRGTMEGAKEDLGVLVEEYLELMDENAEG